VLRISGRDNTGQLAAAARLLHSYNLISAAEAERTPTPSWRTIRLNNADIMDVVEGTDGALEDAAVFVNRMHLARQTKLVPAAAVVGAYLIHRVWDPLSPPIERFWDGLLNPYGLERDDPRAALHRNLVSSKRSTTR
jgi:hypothetical protein